MRRSTRSMRSLAPRGLLVLALVVVLVGCTGSTAGAPILANPTPVRPSLAPQTAPPSAVADPLPVVLPRDDGPHDRLTEWWYYTGHLKTADGGHYGFEFVVFRAERGRFPISWVSHLAITDETGDRFLYSQRLEVGLQVDHSPLGPDGSPLGFDLSLWAPSRRARTYRPAWAMAGSAWPRPPDREPRPRRSGAREGPRRSRPGSAPDGNEACRRSTTRTAGSTSGRRAVRTTTRGPRWRPPARCRSTEGARPVDGSAWFRSPVGRLHLRRRWWLGLVRGQSRGRDGPDPLARPRFVDGTYPLVYGTVVASRWERPPSRPRCIQRRGDRTTGRAPRPAPTIRPAGRSGSRATT